MSSRPLRTFGPLQRRLGMNMKKRVERCCCFCAFFDLPGRILLNPAGTLSCDTPCFARGVDSRTSVPSLFILKLPRLLPGLVKRISVIK